MAREAAIDLRGNNGRIRRSGRQADAFSIGAGEDGKDILEGQSAEEALVRLQALLADWLRMENIVVLVGAGCSVSSGGKTIAALEQAVLDASNLVAPLGTESKKLVAARLAEVGKSPGFEGWLTYVSNALYLTSTDASPIASLNWKTGVTPNKNDLRQLLETVSNAIFAECGLTLPTRDDDIAGPHIPFFAKLIARDSTLGRTHVFTVNYDTLIEQALDALGVQYFDGFTGRARARFDPSVYGLDVYYPGDVSEGKVRRFDKFLHLYKLHGSIHWRASREEVLATHQDLGQYSEYRKGSPAKKAALLAREDFGLGKQILGILPTANKFVQTLDMPYAHLFRAFHARLNIPQTFLLVLGYGFGDEHVNRLIESALTNPSLVMLIVEPNGESESRKRIKRYRDLGRRAYVLTPTRTDFSRIPYPRGSFDDFALEVMPHVQWLEDFSKLRRFEQQIIRDKG